MARIACLVAVVVGMSASLGVRAQQSAPNAAPAEVTFSKHIAPILQRRCFSCHSPNNVAMSLITYNEARPWAAAIREEVLIRHMPPWAAVAGCTSIDEPDGDRLRWSRCPIT